MSWDIPTAHITLDSYAGHALHLLLCPGQLNSSPRDGQLIVGNEIIEASLTWRSRIYEHFVYRKIMSDYFKRGAMFTAIPRPTMDDNLFVQVRGSTLFEDDSFLFFSSFFRRRMEGLQTMTARLSFSRRWSRCSLASSSPRAFRASTLPIPTTRAAAPMSFPGSP